ncbi:DUF2116 family Zn-ribbon domain-containing protein [Gallibacterium anatis]|uniref:DUF2116 family Zn-ribbon domain-containing protein n=1 Tax=Gallibacterium anatis TaxID=750 RepID=UPI0030044B97
MDQIDQADKHSETLKSAQIEHIRNSKPKGLSPTGFCHYCDENLPDKQALFCDADCAEDYAWFSKLKSQKIL